MKRETLNGIIITSIAFLLMAIFPIIAFEIGFNPEKRISITCLAIAGSMIASQFSIYGIHRSTGFANQTIRRAHGAGLAGICVCVMACICSGVYISGRLFSFTPAFWIILVVSIVAQSSLGFILRQNINIARGKT
jgi:hypothetical protein